MRCKSIIFFLLLAFIMLLPIAAESIAVINKTGYDIYYLQVSPESSDSWGDDVLGDDVLLNGDSVKLQTDKFDSCILDIMATDEDDDVYIKWGFDSCEKGKVILTIDDLYVEEAGYADDASAAIQDFTIVNETGYDIYYIYISPDYSDDWEEDVLGEEEILYSGESYHVTFSGYGNHCEFDVRLVDEEGDTYTKWGVNLCGTISLPISLDDLDY